MLALFFKKHPKMYGKYVYVCVFFEFSFSNKHSSLRIKKIKTKTKKNLKNDNNNVNILKYFNGVIYHRYIFDFLQMQACKNVCSLWRNG